MEDKKVRSELESYIDFYMNLLPDMLKQHEGKWTVFAGKEPLGFWNSLGEAAEAAYKAYGNVPMLIREISQEYIKYSKYGKPIIIPAKYLEDLEDKLN